MKPWTSKEIGYLESHAGEGAAKIAAALGRSQRSVQMQAHRLGISLRRRWRCPHCGKTAYSPPNRRTGWCAACTKEAHMGDLIEQAAEMREEAMRNTKADKERQRLYSSKSREKRKIVKTKAKTGLTCENDGKEEGCTQGVHKWRAPPGKETAPALARV